MAQDRYQEGLENLEDLIKDIKIAMMTTIEPDGTLNSRPMATQVHDFDGRLWFFTRANSEKVEEILRNNQVNIAYADPTGNTFVSVSGTVQVNWDRQKIKAFWNKDYEAWVPDGKEDPELVLLEVDVQRAEYWDAPSNKMVLLAGLVKAKLTGKEFRPGKNEEINLEQGELAHTR